MGGDATQLYLPILSVVGMVGMLGTVIWFAAVLSTKVKIQGSELEEIRRQMKDVPSRLEYNALKESMERIEGKIDKFLTQ